MGGKGKWPHKEWIAHMCWSVFRVLLGPEEAQKQEERARAPIVPFGVDLCYWGQEQLTAGKILK